MDLTKPVESMTIPESLERLQLLALNAETPSGEIRKLAEHLSNLTQAQDKVIDEYKRRWANLTATEKLDALAYPPDPKAMSSMFLRHMDLATKRIEELEEKLSILKKIS